jgi:hypothetical protein
MSSADLIELGLAAWLVLGWLVWPRSDSASRRPVPYALAGGLALVLAAVALWVWQVSGAQFLALWARQPHAMDRFFAPAQRFSVPVPAMAILGMLLVAGVGLWWASRWAFGREAVTTLLLASSFVFALQLGAFLTRPDSERRAAIDRQLSAIPGKKLVFVRYWPSHRVADEWVINARDLDASPVIRARDLGVENQKLIALYPDRSVWVLEPDARPPGLSPYVPPAPPPPLPASLAPAVETPKPAAKKPLIEFEPVPEAK